MLEFIVFFYKHRAFIFFISLETICLTLIINKNKYQRVAFFSSANELVGYIDELNYQIRSFFQLKKHNKKLLAENTVLKQQLKHLESLKIIGFLEDTNMLNYKQFTYIGVEVVNKSLFKSNNYITINKGAKHGIVPGMGVISHNSIAGIVKACSDNFSTLYTILHQDISISSQLKNSKTLCSTKWKNGTNKTAYLLHVPHDIRVNQGDTVITSGYNSIFPSNILIGIVSKIKMEPGNIFRYIEIEFSMNFANLSHLYVIKNKMKKEKILLEKDLY